MTRIIKPILLSLLIVPTSILTPSIYAQVPEIFNYQAVIRNSSDQLIANQIIGMQISIIKDSMSGDVVYVETHTPTSNNYGLITLEIGKGTVVSGTFTDLDWSTGTYFLKIETDPSGGTNYTNLGTSQLLSVPYALYAKTAGKVFNETGNNIGDMLYWDGTRWLTIPVGKKGQILQLRDGNIPKWSGEYFPILNTTEAASIKPISAIVGGIIEDWGFAEEFSSKGVLYSLHHNINIDEQEYDPELWSVENWSDELNYSCSLTELTPSTTYYARAYARNDIGTGYGNEISFTTLPPSVPEITTKSISINLPDKAIIQVNVISDGGAPITEQGFCWATSPNPTVYNDTIRDREPNIGYFSDTITGLSSSTIYYARAYAINEIGIGYGNEVNFMTAANDIDGNVYNTVTIGSQIWMKENLKTTKFNNGDTLQTTFNDIGSENSPKYYWDFKNELIKYQQYLQVYIDAGFGSMTFTQLLTESEAILMISVGTAFGIQDVDTKTITEIYIECSEILSSLPEFCGNHYTWYVINDDRNICPTGWHVPSDVEWTELVDYLGGEEVSGEKLINTTNNSGFSAQPAGKRNFNGIFDVNGTMGYWWTSTESSSTSASHRELDFTYPVITNKSGDKKIGYSVRCIKD